MNESGSFEQEGPLGEHKEGWQDETAKYAGSLTTFIRNNAKSYESSVLHHSNPTRAAAAALKDGESFTRVDALYGTNGIEQIHGTLHGYEVFLTKEALADYLAPKGRESNLEN
jgi:hypothetical protein